VWPLAVIFTVAIAGGTRAAVITGVGLGLSRYLGWLLFSPESESPWSSARIASTVLFAVAGWVAGYLLNSQAAADRSISAYRAREEVANTLHDGVLQRRRPHLLRVDQRPRCWFRSRDCLSRPRSQALHRGPTCRGRWPSRDQFTARSRHRSEAAPMTGATTAPPIEHQAPPSEHQRVGD